jgi:hypothetical protein
VDFSHGLVWVFCNGRNYVGFDNEENKMSYRELETRVKYIQKKLANAKGPDPQQELDEEAIENYQLELEKLERALDRAGDYL